MLPDEVWLLIGLLAFLAVMWIAFKLIDAYLKSSKKSKKTKEEKPATAENQNETPAPDQTEPDFAPAYTGSNLADELDKIINDPNSNPAPQPRRHIRAFDRMKKYRESKHYEDFNNDADDGGEQDGTPENNIKLTPEDYKKIVALSHIDAPK